jgi:HEAT repeat protein
MLILSLSESLSFHTRRGLPMITRVFLVVSIYFMAALNVESISLAAPSPEVEQLIKNLKDKDESVRLKAAKDLGKLKEKAKDAIPALKDALNDPDEDVKTIAKKSLDAIKEAVDALDQKAPNEVLAPLVKNLRAKDQRLRLAAIEKLGEMGAAASEASSELVEHGMMDSSAKIREAAMSAMEKIDPTVYKEVVKILIDQNPYNKTQAINALADMGKKGKASIPAIKGHIAQLSNSNSPLTPGVPNAYAAFRAVAAITKISPEDTFALSMVAKAVSSPDEAVLRGSGLTFRNDAIALMNSLKKFDNKAKYTALMNGLAATRGERVLIIKELGGLGADAKGAIPILTKLKLDPNLDVREAATKALAAIKD